MSGQYSLAGAATGAKRAFPGLDRGAARCPLRAPRRPAAHPRALWPPPSGAPRPVPNRSPRARLPGVMALPHAPQPAATPAASMPFPS